jgi:hypothetical protein
MEKSGREEQEKKVEEIKKLRKIRWNRGKITLKEREENEARKGDVETC